MVTALHDEEIEAKARVMMRETIERSGWYPTLRREDRELLIAQDVDRHWQLMIAEARKMLEQRQRPDA
ncbi:hypothetical protein [Microvirga sp. VF16]|uniref:hypothetical protein n=1 Tax=Microvirga sp. VF16 TaxID=2807101 RepID=UPI00193CCAD2|nr:hypothetical protein [Microvirga sp. VF16]QRM35842.1 hypothetical protein JO965_46480 [Microvirga sp. VF16]